MRMRFLPLNFLFVLGFSSAAFGLPYAKVTENQTAQISCATGETISSVAFASYGTPQGTNGSYTVGSCNSSTSRAVVESRCKAGSSGCSVQASNSLFGDPCVGVTKSLAIKVNCVSSWVKCASEYGTCNFTGTRNVRYGANGVYVTKSAVKGPIACTNAYFGSDPAYGVTKSCEYSSVEVAPTPTPAPTATPRPSPTPTPTPIPTATPRPSPSPTPSQVGSNMVPPAAIAIPADTLAVPTNVANGATVSLQCGRVYRGTLDLTSKSNVTVNVSGTCGKPTIVPSSGQNGINAKYAKYLKIDGIKVQGAVRGINVNDTQEVTISNVDILKSSDSGIYSSGVVGMNISNSTISDSGKTGIDGGSWVVKGIVKNTTIVRSGSAGGSYVGIGIYFGDGNNNLIDRVTVTDSVYHGVVVLHNSYTSVSNSIVDRSCTGPDHDCGSIYTGARDKLPLSLRIEGNRVTDSGGIGIYLDDFSNGITVTGNSVSKTLWGVSLHNGFNNTIINNTIFSNRATHVQFGQDVAGAIYGNKVTNNTFKTTNGERTFNLEAGEVRSFALFDYNSYSGTGVSFARSWDGHSSGVDYTYSAWKSYMSSDAHSIMNP